jgi:hypothetical protein
MLLPGVNLHAEYAFPLMTRASNSLSELGWDLSSIPKLKIENLSIFFKINDLLIAMATSAKWGFHRLATPPVAPD